MATDRFVHDNVWTTITVAALAGCDRREPIESCTQNLHGVYVAPEGQRWMLLDNRVTLELFPLFDDSVSYLILAQAFSPFGEASSLRSSGLASRATR